MTLWILCMGLVEKKQISSSVLEAYVPPQLFYNGKVDYFDLQRLGGLLSHLKKTLKGKWFHCQYLNPGLGWNSCKTYQRGSCG